MSIQFQAVTNNLRLSVLFIALSLGTLVGCQIDKTSLINTNLKSSATEMAVVQTPQDNCESNDIASYASSKHVQQSLPSPFSLFDGPQIKTKKQWDCQQKAVSTQVQQNMLGELPQDHTSVSGLYHEDILTVTVTRAASTIRFDAHVILPTTGQAPYPAMIGMGRVSLNNEALLAQGIALINFPNNDIAEQKNGASRGKGKFYQLYGSDHSAGALMAWTWGVSRLIDAMTLTSNLPINTTKLGVTGCSRNGKGALVAGAFDQRIVLTIPQESGAGGSASWRVSEANLLAGENVQTLRQIVEENVWFTQDFADFSETVDRLPFDQHQVLGLVAPRALLIIDNAIDWLGIESSYTNAIAAKTIWQALGVPNAMGVSQTVAHQHCQQPASQQTEINAFVQTYLLGNTHIDTNIEVNENAIVVDQTRWMPWLIPKLR